MTQQELLGKISEKIQTPLEKTNNVLDVILSVITEELLENGLVSIDGFGVFKTQKISEYISLNSKTGERLLMPPSVEIIFEPLLTDSVENESADSDNPENANQISESLSFEPELSLKKRVNSAFVNFQPTLLNEGVELKGIDVISDAEIEEEKVESQITIEDTPPLKKRSSKSRSWVPVIGGVAIFVVALFFFIGKAERDSKE